MDTRWIDELAAEVPDMRVLREAHQIKRFTTGIRFGQGSALAVFEPASLLAFWNCLLYTSPSPRDGLLSRMPSSA